MSQKFFYQSGPPGLCHRNELTQSRELIPEGTATIGGVATWKEGGIHPLLEVLPTAHPSSEASCPELF